MWSTMPVSFPTAEQQARYGRYLGEPTSDDLARFFHLDDVDLTFLKSRRNDNMRLGVAVQLGTRSIYRFARSLILIGAFQT